MKKWKYEIHPTHEAMSEGEPYSIENCLNDWGADGWIFCGHYRRTQYFKSGDRPQYFDVFRRPATDEDNPTP